jgi:hypothetical protein
MTTQTEDKTYNGWRNYETWCINLWMDNDSGSADYWQEQAENCLKHAKPDTCFSRKERATLDLSHIIEEEFKENTPQTTGVYADLLTAALSEVNWYEIAKYLIEENENGKI